MLKDFSVVAVRFLSETDNQDPVSDYLARIIADMSILERIPPFVPAPRAECIIKQ